MNLIIRAWNKKQECWSSLNVAGLLINGDNKLIELHSETLELMQWVEKNDKKGKHIFVGDILKIRVLRHEGDGSCPNIHHGAYYLYAEVADLRGSLKYNREAEEALSQPMGKEQFRQSVSYDYRLFGDLYWSSHFKKDANGEYVKDEDDKYHNWKRFYDYEVVGNIKETPELMLRTEIMKVPKSELVFV